MTPALTKYTQINKVVLLPVDKVLPNPMQPRRNFEPQALSGLAESIAENGLINPITVRDIGGGFFELIAGERRLEAVKLLGSEQIGAIVEDVDDESSAVAAMVENLQRQQLGVFEEAKGIEALMRARGFTQQMAAQRMGMAQSTVANKLRLLKLPEDARQAIEKAGLSERHARALLALAGDEKKLMQAISHIVKKGLNVQESENYIASLMSPPSRRRSVAVIKDLRIFFNTVDKAVRTMREAGLGVDATREEDGDCYRYVIIIPKSSGNKKEITPA